MPEAIRSRDAFSLPPCGMLRTPQFRELAECARHHPEHPGVVAQIAGLHPLPDELARFPDLTVRAVEAELRRRAAAARPIRHCAELRAACDTKQIADEVLDGDDWRRSAQQMLRDQIAAAHKSGMMCHARAIGCTHETLDRPSVQHTAQVVSLEMARNSLAACRLLQAIERGLRTLSQLEEAAAVDDGPPQVPRGHADVVPLPAGRGRARPHAVAPGRDPPPGVRADPIADREKPCATPCTVSGPGPEAVRPDTAAAGRANGEWLPQATVPIAAGDLDPEKRHATPCTVSDTDQRSMRLDAPEPSVMSPDRNSDFAELSDPDGARPIQPDGPIATDADAAPDAGHDDAASGTDGDTNAYANGLHDWRNYPEGDDGTPDFPGLTPGQRNFRLFMAEIDRKRLAYAAACRAAGIVDDPDSDAIAVFRPGAGVASLHRDPASGPQPVTQPATDAVPAAGDRAPATALTPQLRAERKRGRIRPKPLVRPSHRVGA